jgi:hypothetical protein
MDLHRRGGDVMSQLETLLLLQRNCLDSVAATDPADGYMEFACRVAHLRNACELVEAWSLGADWALAGMLRVLSRLADSGAIEPKAANELLAPLYEDLGAVYVDAAMASLDGPAQG